LRFIAECRRLPGGEVVASVEPVILPASSAFARTNLEENRVEVDLGWTSPLSVSGPGAGGEPTAAALLGDLVRVAAPPPNARGGAVSQFASVTDCAEYSWVVGAHTDLAVLAARASELRLGLTERARDGESAFIITDPTSWDQVQRLLLDLEAVGASAFVARYEIEEQEEDLQ
jgi:homoserine dehydrogenase